MTSNRDAPDPDVGGPETTSARESLWLTAPRTEYGPLVPGLHVDVAVLGGGLAGLTAALLLKRDGARVAVIEADRVGGGVSGCTTAKASALQSTIYTTISSRHGDEAASVYAGASVAGVEKMATLADEEKIDCDLGRRHAYTYAADSSERSQVEREADRAQRAGLPVEVVDGFDAAYPVHGAVRLADQIQLHPVRYAQGLAAAVEGDGSRVFEGTRALSLDEGQPCCVTTSRGALDADQVIVATHYPVFDRGLYFARLKPERSYCVAVRLTTTLPNEMSISAGTPTRSVRSHGDSLIVGGEGHPAGSTEAAPKRFAALEAFAREHWDVGATTHRWSAQDPVPFDHLPMIGTYRPGSSRLWVTTGFMKWGLSSATFGAMILADRLAGRDNDWAETFSPNRISLRSAPELAQLGGKFAVDLVGDRLRPPQTWSTERVPPGEARVVQRGLQRLGVYRSQDGTVHAVSLRCTHMGCLLRYNAAERSWDCPCHGSRFDVDGGVLEGPAVSPLTRY